MFSPQKDGVQGTSKTIDLVFLRDFKDASRIVKKMLEKNKGFFYMFAGIALIGFVGEAAGSPVPFLDWGMELATLYAASSVIVLAYKELKPDFDETSVQDKSEKRIIAASASFALSTVLLSMLFVVPGIWFATRSCLATVFACLENCSAGVSITRSQELVKGNLMTVGIYAVFKPFLVWLVMIGAYWTVSFAFNLLGPGFGKYFIAATEGAILFVNAMFQLAIFALLVRLYFELKRSGSAVSPVVPAASAPFAGAPMPMPTPLPEIDDSKLNPRW
jgi:hypothetical protein